MHYMQIKNHHELNEDSRKSPITVLLFIAMKTLSTKAQALIEEIRATTTPDAICPEARGFTKILNKAPAPLVCEIAGISDKEEWDRNDTVLAHQQMTEEKLATETFGDWCLRTGYDFWMNADSDIAYNNLRFDWVNRVWKD